MRILPCEEFEKEPHLNNNLTDDSPGLYNDRAIFGTRAVDWELTE